MLLCFHYPAAPAPWEPVNQFWHSNCSLRDVKAPQAHKVWCQWGMVEVVQKRGHMLCGGVFGVGGLWEHIREHAAVELHEGVKGPLIPQSVKQVVFILINIQESFATTCLDILFHAIFSFLYWSIFL